MDETPQWDALLPLTKERFNAALQLMNQLQAYGNCPIAELNQLRVTIQQYTYMRACGKLDDAVALNYVRAVTELYEALYNVKVAQ